MTDQVLKLEKAPGFLRKLSINVLNKDAAYTLFTLPIEGVPISREQLNAWLGPLTFESWYEQHKDGSWHPMGWWSNRDNGNFELDTKFACKTAFLTIEGTDYQFEEYSADEEGEDDDEDGDELRPGARISSIKLKPTPGGVTLLSFHMQVRPGFGKANVVLQEHMFRHVAITFGDTAVLAKKSKQQSLPLPTPESDAVIDKQIGRPPVFESRGGEAIDAEMRARHPEASEEVMGADAMTITGDDGAPTTESAAAAVDDMDPADDLAKFEEGAAQRLKDFTSVSQTGAIDGTTPRSRRRRRSEDTAH
jgi:hypothetical protein